MFDTDVKNTIVQYRFYYKRSSNDIKNIWYIFTYILLNFKNCIRWKFKNRTIYFLKSTVLRCRNNITEVSFNASFKFQKKKKNSNGWKPKIQLCVRRLKRLRIQFKKKPSMIRTESWNSGDGVSLIHVRCFLGTMGGMHSVSSGCFSRWARGARVEYHLRCIYYWRLCASRKKRRVYIRAYGCVHLPRAIVTSDFSSFGSGDCGRHGVPACMQTSIRAPDAPWFVCRWLSGLGCQLPGSQQFRSTAPRFLRHRGDCPRNDFSMSLDSAQRANQLLSSR